MNINEKVIDIKKISNLIRMFVWSRKGYIQYHTVYDAPAARTCQDDQWSRNGICDRWPQMVRKYHLVRMGATEMGERGRRTL